MKFMDIHTGFVGVTADQLAAAHAADQAIEADEGAHFEQAWLDPLSGKVFCLVEAPSAEALQRVHVRAGHPADEIHAVTITV